MKKDKIKINNFSEFLCDPPIAMSLFLIALVALFLAILEFGRAIS